jgi:hypothetical protein
MELRLARHPGVTDFGPPRTWDQLIESIIIRTHSEIGTLSSYRGREEHVEMRVIPSWSGQTPPKVVVPPCSDRESPTSEAACMPTCSAHQQLAHGIAHVKKKYLAQQRYSFGCPSSQHIERHVAQWAHRSRASTCLTPSRVYLTE